MKLHLIRHGETALNTKRAYQGHTDEPLSLEGASRLKKASATPQRVYVSPLARAKQTAEILFPQACLVEVSGLKEINFGIFEGLSAQDLRDNAAFQAWVDSLCLSAPPCGENRADFIKRTCDSVRSVLEAEQQQGSQEVTIVAHGGTIMAVMSAWDSRNRDFYAWHTGNGTGFTCEATGNLANPQLKINTTLDFNQTS